MLGRPTKGESVNRIIGKIEFVTWECAGCAETVTASARCDGEPIDLVCQNCGLVSVLFVIPKGVHFTAFAHEMTYHPDFAVKP